MKACSFIFSLFFIITITAQDTLSVQTFEFSDIAKRRGWFNFPTDTTTWEKILMEYTIKCDAATIADGFACGEWDFTTFTNVYNHTELLDSNILVHPEYIINGENPDEFFIHTNPVFDTYQSYQYSTVLNSASNEVEYDLGNGDESASYIIPSSTNSSKAQFILTEEELSSAGLSAGSIGKMSFDVNSLGEMIDVLNIRLANIADDEFNGTYINTASTLVYNGSFQGSIGQNDIYFMEAFDWNGVSNILIEFEIHTDQIGVDFELSASTIPGAECIYQEESNGFYKFSQGTYIDVPASAFESIDEQITVSAWTYGNPDILPTATYLFQGVNEDNNRLFSTHLPWGNGQVYWDAGHLGTYDRINKVAPESAYEGQWNHWAFTKNSATGHMKIYLNGTLFHEGNNRIRSMEGATKFRIGSSSTSLSQTYYEGFIDEFRVWDVELDQSTIAEYMNKSITPSHPHFDNLLVNFTFDQEVSPIISEQSVNEYQASVFGMPSYEANNLDLSYNLVQTELRPDISLYNGDYDISIDSTLVFDLVEVPSTSVQVYTDTALLPLETSIIYGWEREYGYIFDPAGNIIDSTFYGFLQEFQNQELSYWNVFDIVETVQLGNYVTPYGIGLSLGEDGWTYLVDVSDYVLYLKDSVDLQAHNTQELLDLKFHFIEGTPGRNVLSSQVIWSGQYSLEGISENNDLPARDILLNSDASHFVIKTRATGHGFGSGINCSEFCATNHFVKVNGVEQYSWQNWTECADNPIIDQGGTWIFDRAGWCPGDFADTYHWDITPFVEAGQVNSIEYGIDPVSIPDGNQRIAFQLIEYGETNFEVDAEIRDILSPSNADRHSNFNPVCGNAEVMIANRGSENLTSAQIIYNVQGGTELSYDWQGNLAYGETEVVTLPISTVTWWGPTNIFEVRIENPNGLTDEYPNNNVYKTVFESTPEYNGHLEIRFRTNSFPFENEWWIYDEVGNEVYNKDFTQANVTHNDTITLEQGCYRFVVEDSDDDGLSFFANSDGTGFVRIRDVDASNTLITFNPNFGKFIDHQFTVGYTTGIDDISADAYIFVYPNPANDILNVEMDGFTGREYIVELIDSQGKVVRENVFRNSGNELTHEINLANLNSGIYFLRVQNDLQIKTEKIIIE